MDIREIQKMIKEGHNPYIENNPRTTILHFLTEVGEFLAEILYNKDISSNFSIIDFLGLMKIIKSIEKCIGKDIYDIDMEYYKNIDSISKEIADIDILLYFVSTSLNIDREKALIDKLRENIKRGKFTPLELEKAKELEII